MMTKLFVTTVAGVGPYCVEFDDGEIITTRSKARQIMIADMGNVPEGDKYFESFTALHRALDTMDPPLTGAQWKHVATALIEVAAKYGAAT